MPVYTIEEAAPAAAPPPPTRRTTGTRTRARVEPAPPVNPGSPAYREWVRWPGAVLSIKEISESGASRLVATVWDTDVDDGALVEVPVLDTARPETLENYAVADASDGVRHTAEGWVRGRVRNEVRGLLRGVAAEKVGVGRMARYVGRTRRFVEQLGSDPRGVISQMEVRDGERVSPPMESAGALGVYLIRDRSGLLIDSTATVTLSSGETIAGQAYEADRLYARFHPFNASAPFSAPITDFAPDAEWEQAVIAGLPEEVMEYLAGNFSLANYETLPTVGTMLSSALAVNAVGFHFSLASLPETVAHIRARLPVWDGAGSPVPEWEPGAFYRTGQFVRSPFGELFERNNFRMPMGRLTELRAVPPSIAAKSWTRRDRGRVVTALAANPALRPSPSDAGLPDVPSPAEGPLLPPIVMEPAEMTPEGWARQTASYYARMAAAGMTFVPAPVTLAPVSSAPSPVDGPTSPTWGQMTEGVDVHVPAPRGGIVTLPTTEPGLPVEVAGIEAAAAATVGQSVTFRRADNDAPVVGQIVDIGNGRQGVILNVDMGPGGPVAEVATGGNFIPAGARVVRPPLTVSSEPAPQARTQNDVTITGSVGVIGMANQAGEIARPTMEDMVEAGNREYRRTAPLSTSPVGVPLGSAIRARLTRAAETVAAALSVPVAGDPNSNQFDVNENNADDFVARLNNPVRYAFAHAMRRTMTEGSRAPYADGPTVRYRGAWRSWEERRDPSAAAGATVGVNGVLEYNRSDVVDTPTGLYISAVDNNRGTPGTYSSGRGRNNWDLLNGGRLMGLRVADERPAAEIPALRPNDFVGTLYRVVNRWQDRGERPQVAHYRRRWEANDEYVSGDIAFYQGVLYMALRANNHRNPTQNTDDWLTLAEVLAPYLPFEAHDGVARTHQTYVGFWRLATSRAQFADENEMATRLRLWNEVRAARPDATSETTIYEPVGPVNEDPAYSPEMNARLQAANRRMESDRAERQAAAAQANTDAQVRSLLIDAAGQYATQLNVLIETVNTRVFDAQQFAPPNDPTFDYTPVNLAALDLHNRLRAFAGDLEIEATILDLVDGPELRNRIDRATENHSLADVTRICTAFWRGLDERLAETRRLSALLPVPDAAPEPPIVLLPGDLRQVAIETAARYLGEIHRLAETARTRHSTGTAIAISDMQMAAGEFARTFQIDRPAIETDDEAALVRVLRTAFMPFTDTDVTGRVSGFYRHFDTEMNAARRLVRGQSADAAMRGGNYSETTQEAAVMRERLVRHACEVEGRVRTGLNQIEGFGREGRFPGITQREVDELRDLSVQCRARLARALDTNIAHLHLNDDGDTDGPMRDMLRRMPIVAGTAHLINFVDDLTPVLDRARALVERASPAAAEWRAGLLRMLRAIPSAVPTPVENETDAQRVARMNVVDAGETLAERELTPRRARLASMRDFYVDLARETGQPDGLIEAFRARVEVAILSGDDTTFNAYGDALLGMVSRGLNLRIADIPNVPPPPPEGQGQTLSTDEINAIINRQANAARQLGVPGAVVDGAEGRAIVPIARGRNIPAFRHSVEGFNAGLRRVAVSMYLGVRTMDDANRIIGAPAPTGESGAEGAPVVLPAGTALHVGRDGRIRPHIGMGAPTLIIGGETVDPARVSSTDVSFNVDTAPLRANLAEVRRAVAEMHPDDALIHSEMISVTPVPVERRAVMGDYENGVMTFTFPPLAGRSVSDWEVIPNTAQTAMERTAYVSGLGQAVAGAVSEGVLEWFRGRAELGAMPAAAPASLVGAYYSRTHLTENPAIFAGLWVAGSRYDAGMMVALVSGGTLGQSERRVALYLAMRTNWSRGSRFVSPDAVDNGANRFWMRVE